MCLGQLKFLRMLPTLSRLIYAKYANRSVNWKVNYVNLFLIRTVVELLETNYLMIQNIYNSPNKRTAAHWSYFKLTTRFKSGFNNRNGREKGLVISRCKNSVFLIIERILLDLFALSVLFLQTLDSKMHYTSSQRRLKTNSFNLI